MGKFIQFLSDTRSRLYEVTIDANKGIGAVPYNADVDYFGMQVLMRPSVFLSVSTELPIDAQVQDRIDKMVQYIKDGGAIGPPFLDLKFPPEWDDNDFSDSAKIVNHEGRHRMNAILLADGDAPVEVHLFPKGGYRARDITDGMKQRLNQDVISQRGQLIRGPWFTI